MADVLAMRGEYRVKTWAMLIWKCQTSMLTNKEFCH